MHIRFNGIYPYTICPDCWPAKPAIWQLPSPFAVPLRVAFHRCHDAWRSILCTSYRLSLPSFWPVQLRQPIFSSDRS